MAKLAHHKLLNQFHEKKFQNDLQELDLMDNIRTFAFNWLSNSFILNCSQKIPLHCTDSYQILNRIILWQGGDISFIFIKQNSPEFQVFVSQFVRSHLVQHQNLFYIRHELGHHFFLFQIADLQ